MLRSGAEQCKIHIRSFCSESSFHAPKALELYRCGEETFVPIFFFLVCRDRISTCLLDDCSKSLFLGLLFDVYSNKSNAALQEIFEV